jgi:hypothetical protein
VFELQTAIEDVSVNLRCVEQVLVHLVAEMFVAAYRVFAALAIVVNQDSLVDVHATSFSSRQISFGRFSILAG